jgi:16S rRNA (guanine1516-N2)-methyltransferase
MFEDANEKTSPRKEMRIFRSLVGKDQDAEQVFQMAHSKGPKRLVVKRPRQSISLYQKPSVQYIGKSTRYDVYFSV